jgi:hypothetical protein
MSIRFPVAVAVAVALILGLLLLASASEQAGASNTRLTACGDIKAPKNDNGLNLKRNMDVKADHLDCHTAKKTLKKFIKNFDSNEHTNINGFDCRIPQRGNGSVFYSCRMGNKLAKGLPKG